MSSPLRRRAVTILALALLVSTSAACSSSGTRADDPDHHDDPTPTGPRIVDGSLQQLWLLDRIAAIDETGTEIDITDELLTLAAQDPGDPKPLASSSTFTPSNRFKPQMLDVDGEVLDSVRMTGGVIETDGGDRWAAVLATPDADEWTIGRNTTLRLDLPETAGVMDGSPMVVDHAYFQYLPIEGADGTDRTEDPLDLLNRRATVGAIAHAAAGDDDTILMTGQIGIARAVPPAPQMLRSQGNKGRRTTTSRWKDRIRDKAVDVTRNSLVKNTVDEVASRLDLPADALPLLEAYAKAAAELLSTRCTDALCMRKFYDTVAKGFAESLDLVEDKLDFDRAKDHDDLDDRDRMPDPDSTPPPGRRKPRRPGRLGDDRDDGGGDCEDGAGAAGGCGDSPSPGSPGGPGGPGGSGSGGNGSGGSGSGGNGSGGNGSGGGDSGGSGGSGDSGGDGSGGGSGSRSRLGAIKTDPHLITFDGRGYSLQAIGEFTAAASDDLEVQVRFEPVPCDCIASITTAVVVGTGDHRIEVDVYDQSVITVDGEPIPLDAPSQPAGRDGE